jgi:hypothetical protein
MHCHILGHEERGMMACVDVVGPGGGGAAATSRPAAPPAGHSHHRH